MPSNLLIDFFLSVFDLVKGAAIVSVIVFLLTLLASFLQKKIRKKFDWSWIKSAFLTTYLVVFILVLIFYFSPWIYGFSSQTIGVPIPGMEYNLIDFSMLVLIGIVNALIVSMLFSFLLLPLEFIGVFVQDYFKKRFEKLNPLISLFIAVFVSTLIAVIVLFFLLPWTLPVLVNLMFFGIFR